MSGEGDGLKNSKEKDDEIYRRMMGARERLLDMTAERDTLADLERRLAVLEQRLK